MFLSLIVFVFIFNVSAKPNIPFVEEDDAYMHPKLFRSSQHREVNEEENTANFWTTKAQATLSEKLQQRPNTNIAKNVIMFLGDGMSLPTLKAARIYLGQMLNENDEAVELSFEKFPYTALSKTYCVDVQVPDSACTATAYLTGVKTNDATIGVTADVKVGDCAASLDENNRVSSIGRWSQLKNKRTGIVTSTRVTHASPAGVYAHIPDRDWEGYIWPEPNECDDIAYQLVHGETGENFNVILGGGRREFRSSDVQDEENSNGNRQDNLDLIEEWLESKRDQNAAYVWNRTALLDLPDGTEYVLGLFEASHCNYHLEADEQLDPTLEEMTEAAIKILSKSENGFFLFVEGGRIDHAHHGTTAQKALDETIEFAKAVQKAYDITNEEDTLIVVTADHSHTMTVNGYPPRGNDIFGTASMATDDIPFATLSYANGPGYRADENDERHDCSKDDMSDPNYEFPALAPLDSETHGGDEVPIYATGPWAHLYTGVIEQNVIPHIMAYASCVGSGANACDDSEDSKDLKLPNNRIQRQISDRVKTINRKKHKVVEDSNNINRLINYYDDAHMHPKPTTTGTVKEINPEENKADYWMTQAQFTLAEKLKITPNTNIAKNVIMFLGDGMSIPNLKASRIYLGQLTGESNDEAIELFFEKFPYAGLSKTYCVDVQVPDSACTATAYLSGVKTNDATIGVTGKVKLRDCLASTDENNRVFSIGRWSQLKNKRTGLVTTTRVTHASPAGVYAHTADRDWEGYTPTVCDDIALQLIHGETGRNLNVILGGGRQEFRPSTAQDEENSRGNREDNRDLIQEWLNTKSHVNATYIWNRTALLELPESTEYVLGLFEASHCNYHLDADPILDPTLEEMTEAAIKILSKSENGYFLFVEGGRIDHAHHDTRAHKALDETVEFAKAIRRAYELTNGNETLIVVTADHAHAFTVNGYPLRGNDIFGVASMGTDDIPFATLSYANGPGYRPHVNGKRYDCTEDDMKNPNYEFPALAPLNSETHGGDEVAIFATGPWAHLFTGVMEQNVIPHIMGFASCVGNGITMCGDTGGDGGAQTIKETTLAICLSFLIIFTILLN